MIPRRVEMRLWRVIDVIDGLSITLLTFFKNVLNMYNEIFLSVNDVDDVFKNVLNMYNGIFLSVNDASITSITLSLMHQ